MVEGRSLLGTYEGEGVFAPTEEGVEASNEATGRVERIPVWRARGRESQSGRTSGQVWEFEIYSKI